MKLPNNPICIDGEKRELPVERKKNVSAESTFGKAILRCIKR